MLSTIAKVVLFVLFIPLGIVLYEFARGRGWSFLEGLSRDAREAKKRRELKKWRKEIKKKYSYLDKKK